MFWEAIKQLSLGIDIQELETVYEGHGSYHHDGLEAVSQWLDERVVWLSGCIQRHNGSPEMVADDLDDLKEVATLQKMIRDELFEELAQSVGNS
jgi:hypothetical protein